ncbi:hypothetical protein FGO68_gene8072 [Halteria grandinella]|uniref:Transmembrane protein n=1 Tax=Halteria grandinella TaxID=5974 RepID=A0A8J8SXX1_HALGN|nr:hypothetical protein FGO68_gene8072 [Halteria grandinella]
MVTCSTSKILLPKRAVAMLFQIIKLLNPQLSRLLAGQEAREMAWQKDNLQIYQALSNIPTVQIQNIIASKMSTYSQTKTKIIIQPEETLTKHFLFQNSLRIQTTQLTSCKDQDNQCHYRPSVCFNQPHEQCQIKSRVINKIGSNFKFIVPKNGTLNIINIIFDSIDSVIDCKVLIIDNFNIEAIDNSCLDKLHICCQVELINGPVSCTNPYDPSAIQPLFHKFNHCHSKALGGGLFYLVGTSSDTYPTLSIQNCEFQNFFQEMSSLVVITSQHANLSIQDSLFNQFSSCGSIISNGIDFNITQSPNFKGKEYALYLEDYIKTNQNQFSEFIGGPALEYSLTLQGNTFKDFNFLKRWQRDRSDDRILGGVARVANEKLRNNGLILSLYGGRNLKVHIVENAFQDIIQYFGSWNGQKLDPCSAILSEISTQKEELSGMGLYIYQQTHLISITNNSQSTIIIEGNTLKNLSLSGPLLQLAETQGNHCNKYVIKNNQFSFIHGYINSNIIYILREQSDIYNLTQRMLMGGNIIINGNNFSEIAGCPTVSTGILMISVRKGSNHYYSQALNLVSEDDFEDSTTLQDADRLQQLPSQISIISTSSGKLSLYEGQTILQNNAYTNISMGVATADIASYHGSLIKFVNVFKASLQNETFMNIGGYTVEHSKELLSLILNIEKALFSSNIKTELFGEENEPLWTAKQNIQSMPFMQTYLSTSLIFCNSMHQLIITGNFNNIWLIDRFNALKPLQQQGVILYLSNFKGKLQIGDGSSLSTIKGIQGMLNPFTIERFQNWDPKLYPYSDESEKVLFPFDEMIYGAGSILFHIHSESNEFSEITLMNIVFKNNYHRATRYKYAEGMPSIMSTFINQTQQQGKQIKRISLQNVTLSRSTYENSGGYFQLTADDLVLSGVKFDDIGNWNMLEDKDWESWEIDTSEQDKGPFSSLIQILMPTSDSAANLMMEKSSFVRINAGLGALPILDVGIVQNSGQRMTLRFNELVISGGKGGTELPQSILLNIRNLQFKSNANVTLDIKKLTVKDSESQYGIFRIDEKLTLQDFKITQSTFSQLNGKFASTIAINHQVANQIAMSDSIFYGALLDQRAESAILNDHTNIQEAHYNKASMIKISNAVNIHLSNITAKYHYYAYTGAFLQATDSSQVSLSDSSISHMSSLHGGAILVFHESSLNISNSQFYSLTANDSGVIQAKEKSSVYISDSAFEDNGAVMNGVFKFATQASFIIENSSFRRNKCITRNSIGQVFQSYKEATFRNIIFQENAAKTYMDYDDQQGTAIELIQAEHGILFDNCKFIDNKALFETSCLHISSCRGVMINNTIFSSEEGNLGRFGVRSFKYGVFMRLMPISSVRINNCTFQGGRGQKGGAIFSLGENKIDISASKFVNNTVYVDGGAIYADEVDIIHITGSQFHSNEAAHPNIRGDSISLKGGYEFKISDSVFTSKIASNFISAQSVFAVGFESCIMRHEENFLIQNVNAGIHLRNVIIMIIRNNLFENLYGNYSLGGGAIILEQSTGYADQLYIGQAYIGENTFENCRSDTNGGALTLLNIDNILVTGCKFIKNTAKVSGGSIYSSCIKPYDCNYRIEDSEFINNTAYQEGGAIKWTFTEPSFTNLKYQNNQAGLYGDDIASIARVLVRIIKEQVATTKYNNETIIKDVETQSGTSIDLYFGLVDKYGQFVQSDTESKLSIKTNKKISRMIDIAPVIESQTQVTAQSGFFIVENFVLVSQPNSTQSLHFTTNGIDENIDDNMKFFDTDIQILQESKNYLDIEFLVSSCLEGESFLPNGRCQRCSLGQYMLQIPSEPTSCLQCQQQVSECLGGSNIYPLPGYWRSSNISETFYGCLYPKSCLGRQNSLENYQGVCEVGYQGVLCADCQDEYSKDQSNHKCTKCPNNNQNIFILLLMALFFLSIILILVRSNMIADTAEKNYLPVFFRILLNHLQILFFTASFDLDWPEDLLQFFKNIQPISDAQSQLFSIDCFVKNTHYFHSFQAKRIFEIKIVLIAVLPIALIFLSFVIVKCIELKQKQSSNQTLQLQNEDSNNLEHSVVNINEKSANTQDLSQSLSNISNKQGNGYFISILIIILFLIHPTVTKEMFSIFNCKMIDNVQRLLIDLETVCYEGDHKFIAYWIAAPSILIYSIGIPTFGFAILMKKKNQLEAASIKRQYGFLYNGYKEGFSQYWEMIVIYRKVILVFIQIFLAQRGKVTQALITLLFLVFCIVLLKKYEPYSKSYLNRLELMSLLTSALSVYFGLYFISSHVASLIPESLNFQITLSQQESMILFILIVAAHASFFFYWLVSFIKEFHATIRQKQLYSLERDG